MPQFAYFAQIAQFNRTTRRGDDTRMICESCQTEVPYEARACLGCGADVGFPNVRAASLRTEVESLEERVRYAQTSSIARDCGNKLEIFGTAILESQAVIARPLSVLDSLINQDNLLMISYHKQVRAGRIPQQNSFDERRISLESLIHPFNVHEDIQYGCLSLDGFGVRHFGGYHITLKNAMIEARSTVFEENPFNFFDKHHIGARDPVPTGYRATWLRRAELAMAKLHPRINPEMQSIEFPRLLVDSREAEDSDFIEVHIYGAIHRRAIERVCAVAPKDRTDKVIWRKVKRSLAELGIEVREV